MLLVNTVQQVPLLLYHVQQAPIKTRQDNLLASPVLLDSSVLLELLTILLIPVLLAITVLLELNQTLSSPVLLGIILPLLKLLQVPIVYFVLEETIAQLLDLPPQQEHAVEGISVCKVPHLQLQQVALMLIFVELVTSVLQEQLFKSLAIPDLIAPQLA